MYEYKRETSLIIVNLIIIIITKIIILIQLKFYDYELCCSYPRSIIKIKDFKLIYIVYWFLHHKTC
jgi:hypothetical protein